MKSTTAHTLAIVLLCLQPLLWLWPCVFGDRTFVPYDTAEFPPASLNLTAAEHAAIKAGKNHDVTEVPVWFLPELELARDELRAGRLPTWDPHARGGAPLHAHGLLGLCYPPNWLALFADHPATRLGWLCWSSLMIAGLLAFGLLREVKLSVQAAWFGAMLFQLGAPMAVNGFFWMRLASLVWLPGVLWAMLRLSRHERLRAGPLTALAVTFAMPWLAGFPPFATTTAVLAGLLGLRLVAERLGQQGPRPARQLAMHLGLGLVLGAMLAMPQVLPSLQFFPLSARTPDPSMAQISQSRFEAYGLLGYVLPDAFSHPNEVATLPYHKQPLCFLLSNRVEAEGRRLEPNFNYTEYAVFFGTLGLLLAGFGAIRGRAHLRWFVIVALGLLFGLALMVPGVHLLYLLPVVKNVWPMRWLVPGALLFAWLAAIGLDRLWLVERRSLLRLAGVTLLLAALVPFVASRPAAWHAADAEWPARTIASRYAVPVADATAYLNEGAAPGVDRFVLSLDRLATVGVEAGLWLLAFGALLLAFALLGERPHLRPWPLRAAMLLALVELVLHGQPLLRGCELPPPQPTPVHTFLRDQASAAAAQGGFTIVRGGLTPDIPSQLPPGQVMATGVRDLNFYTHFDGRSLAAVRRLLGVDYGNRAAAKGYLELLVPDTIAGLPYAPLEHPLLDLLGVRYVLAVRFDPKAPELQHAGRRIGPPMRGPGGEFLIYERSSALPRAFVVPELRVLADDDAVLQALVLPAFKPREFVYATATDAAGLTATTSGRADQRSVQFTTDLPTQVELDVGAGESPWLVLSDTFLPGWTATIDEQPTAIYRADHALRLVHLPPTTCRVRFTYRSPGLLIGTLLAAFATGTLLVLWFATRQASHLATTPR